MLGTGLHFGRSHGEDRFYDAAKARRNHHHHQTLQRPRSSAAAAASPSLSPKDKAIDGRVLENSSAALSSSASAALGPACNLDSFLESITPSVPAQYLSKTSMRGWRTCDVEYRPYFILGDLWDSFKECSAYGAGVPLVLNESDSVIQYYVPYLSAIQLYGEPSRQDASSRYLHNRRPGRDSSSDESSDCEVESGLQYSRDQSKNHLTSSSMLAVDRLSLMEMHASLQEGFSSDEGETRNPQDCLLFEFLEHIPPYKREPLADKILDLARNFPELRTLRSCDLSPMSWISVAWYPIYRIPTGPTLKDLDACFLTFHSLSTPLTGTAISPCPTVAIQEGTDGVPLISLPVFGLASHKFNASIWIPTGGSERQPVDSLLEDAKNWLGGLNVTHPDYKFFLSHSKEKSG